MDSEEVQQALELIKGVTQDAKQAAIIAENLKFKLDAAPDPDEEGISLLHLKNLEMVEYMTQLVYLILKKSSGKSIQNDPAIDRIVQTRTVLEKIRPMEKKLKYQMDKFIRLADNNTVDNDPLHFKPNLDALDDDDDDEEEDDDEEATDKKADKKYVVPKHVPTLPNDDLTLQEVENEERVKAKKKTLSKSIMEDLKRQYMDTPEEEFNQGGHLKAKHAAEMRERIRYEEDNYMRLPALSKKEQHKRRKSMSTVGTIGDELTYFGKNNFYNNDPESRKRKKVSSKKGGKKKFKRR